jgi:hypothetical protein
MKATLLAATLGLLVGAPLMASASERAPVTNSAVTLACHETTQQLYACMPAARQSARPRFVGPYELHHGLLPNGLAPNPFNYG